MTERIGLQGPYIQVKRKTGEITYGGDQGFFQSEKGREAVRKEAAGCGIVAFADTLLYLAGRDRSYLLEGNKDFVNRILSEEEYRKYFDSLYKIMGGIPWKNGVSGVRLQRKFNRLARKNKWKLRAFWALDGGKIYERAEEMLRRDVPVILCIPMMLPAKERKDKLWLYEKEVSGYRRDKKVSAHYVTVTGITAEGHITYLEISSWGRKFYICWEEYEDFIHTHFMGTILGNILYIR